MLTGISRQAATFPVAMSRGCSTRSATGATTTVNAGVWSAACPDDAASADASTPPTPDATPDPTPSPTPEPDPTFDPTTGFPEPTPAMDTADAAGAEAAALHFAEMVYAAGTSGDASGLAALSHPDCVPCQGIVDAIARIHTERADAGVRKEDGVLTFTWVRAFEVAPGSWTVDVDFDEGPGTLYDTATGEVRDQGTRIFTRHQDIDLVHDGERWLVTGTATELVTWADE